jgi:hypothetical protein
VTSAWTLSGTPTLDHIKLRIRGEFHFGLSPAHSCTELALREPLNGLGPRRDLPLFFSSPFPQVALPPGSWTTARDMDALESRESVSLARSDSASYHPSFKLEWELTSSVAVR